MRVVQEFCGRVWLGWRSGVGKTRMRLAWEGEKLRGSRGKHCRVNMVVIAVPAGHRLIPGAADYWDGPGRETAAWVKGKSLKEPAWELSLRERVIDRTRSSRGRELLEVIGGSLVADADWRWNDVVGRIGGIVVSGGAGKRGRPNCGDLFGQGALPGHRARVHLRAFPFAFPRRSRHLYQQ